MLAFASRFSVRTFFAALCCLPLQPAHAFGPQTHAWLAQRLLDDISRDCRLEIAGRRYDIKPESCAAIRDNHAYFMAGATGTTNFPDPVVARLTLRQGISGGWSSGEWLQQLVQRADSPQALAFALGNVFQAGQEVFANSYVNTFSGAAFSLQSDDEVLQRHIAIEGYLDMHLPAGAAVSTSRRLPLDFLRTFYLENPQVLAQYQKLPEAAHLRAMHDLPAALQAAAQDMESVQIMAEEMLIYFSSMPFSQEALRAEFASHSAVHVDDGATAASKEPRWLNAKATRARQQDALSQADARLQAMARARELQIRKISDQEKRLLKLPSLVRHEDCRDVRKWINSKEWKSHRVCQKTSSANPARAKVRLQIDAERAALAALNAKRQQVLLQRDLAAADLGAAEAELKAAAHARQVRIADPDSLMALLVRRADAMQSLRLALSALDEISALSRQWQDDISAANRDYLRSARLHGDAIGKMVAPDVQVYRDWLACSGRVYLIQPQTDVKLCDEALHSQEMQAIQQRLEAALSADALRPLREQYELADRRSGAALRRQLLASTQALNDFVAPTSALARLSRLASVPLSGREQLQDLLASSGKGQQALLTVRNGADLIDADAGIATAGVLDVDAFNAMQYAELFSRMAMLPGSELNRLAGRTAGWYFARWHLHPEKEEGTYSLIFTALRSIDGNQQWQPYGLPYARAAGVAEPQQAEQRHYGYGPADGEHAGLAIFINTDARREVFLSLFPRRLSLLENHPRMQAPNYPFPSCEANPFPVTFTRTGNASSSDSNCSPREIVQH